MTTITQAIHELDFNLGNVNCQIETLFGAKVLLEGIKTELDDASYSGDTVYPITQINLKLNAILGLMGYTLDDASKTMENVMNHHHTVFNHIVTTSEEYDFDVDPAFRETLEKEHAKQKQTKKEQKKDQPGS